MGVLNLDHNFSNNIVLSTQHMIASLKSSSSSFKNSWNDVGRDDNNESTTDRRKGSGLLSKGRKGGQWVHRRNQSCTKIILKI